MSSAIRIIDLGDVPWLLSQALFHGVAHAMTAETPDTITLCSPTSPYVSVGFHQDAAREVDIDYCRANGIPVVRREVGGGAVYLDNGQLFWHTIFHKSRVPATIEEVYSRFLAGPVAAYRAMGIEAVHRPVNDIQVHGRKIGGTGAAEIGAAMVVAGSLIFDFNYELMAQVLKVPSEKFRDKVYQSLQAYLSTIRRELGARAPSKEEGKAILVQEFARALGAPVEFGQLTEREQAAIAEAAQRLQRPEWTFIKGGLQQEGVKIAAGIQVLEADFKAPGGMIRAAVRVRDGHIDDISISGDFFIYPAAALGELEAALVGAPWTPAAIADRIADFYNRRAVTSPGVDPADLCQALAAAGPVVQKE